MTTTERPALVSRKIFIYKIAIFFMAIGIFVIGYQDWRLRKDLAFANIASETYPDSKTAPYYKEIMDIIQPLDYSVIPSLLLQPDIKLSIDFTNKTWTLHNFHQYQPNGDIVLEYNRYGLCGELAEHTYEQLKSFLPNRYTVKFANVAQSGFFLHPRGNHVVLVIYDNLKSKAYLIDPGLHRYGPIEDYKDYSFFSFAEKVEGIDSKQADETFFMNHGMPLIIHNNYISVLSVEDNDGKFDKDNFIISVQANRRYEYTGYYLFSIQKQGGVTKFYENKSFENDALSPEDSDIVKKTITAWFNSLGK